MGKAKDIVLRPISAQQANALVRKVHYSGKVVNNSQFHIGVFLNGKLEGAMQFGPSLDKRKLMGLVAGTAWNEFIELNRMAFSEALPRNSESRAIGIAMRILRKHAPHLKWVVSFADGTQCGDGTIYRASGFVLTGIGANGCIWQRDDGTTTNTIQLHHQTGFRVSNKRIASGMFPGVTGLAEGFQLRYVYFLDQSIRELLTVPILPFSEIARRGARMYRGQKPSVGSVDNDTSPAQGEEGGASPTPTPQP